MLVAARITAHRLDIVRRAVLAYAKQLGVLDPEQRTTKLRRK